jgi:hypothetical protein
MPRSPRLTPTGCPAAVSIHDHGHVQPAWLNAESPLHRKVYQRKKMIG